MKKAVDRKNPVNREENELVALVKSYSKDRFRNKTRQPRLRVAIYGAQDPSTGSLDQPEIPGPVTKPANRQADSNHLEAPLLLINPEKMSILQRSVS